MKVDRWLFVSVCLVSSFCQMCATRRITHYRLQGHHNRFAVVLDKVMLFNELYVYVYECTAVLAIKVNHVCDRDFNDSH